MNNHLKSKEEHFKFFKSKRFITVIVWIFLPIVQIEVAVKTSGS
jgi:hypothetical protein